MAKTSDSLYQITHQHNDCTLQVSFMSNEVMEQASARDLGEELSHFPHKQRREFVEQIHELYGKYRCIQEIRQKLMSQTYYQHVLRTKHILINIILHYDRKLKHYHYFLYI